MTVVCGEEKNLSVNERREDRALYRRATGQSGPSVGGSPYLPADNPGTQTHQLSRDRQEDLVELPSGAAFSGAAILDAANPHESRSGHLWWTQPTLLHPCIIAAHKPPHNIATVAEHAC